MFLESLQFNFAHWSPVRRSLEWTFRHDTARSVGWCNQLRHFGSESVSQKISFAFGYRICKRTTTNNGPKRYRSVRIRKHQSTVLEDLRHNFLILFLVSSGAMSAKHNTWTTYKIFKRTNDKTYLHSHVRPLFLNYFITIDRNSCFGRNYLFFCLPVIFVPV